MTGEISSNLTHSPQAAPDPIAANDGREVWRWHLVWAIGLAAAGLALAMGSRQGQWAFAPALGVGLLPAVGAWVLAEHDSARGRDLLLTGWAVVGALACCLSGGVSGPLAVWCAMPMAAAVILGGPHRLAQGAALSLLAVAVAALAELDRMAAAAPSGLVGVGLGLIGVGSTAVGLAAAMLAARRRAARADETRIQAGEALRRTLGRQPHLILTLDQAGRIDGAFGDEFQARFAQSCPTGGQLVGEPISVVGAALEQPALEAALQRASADGYAALTFRAPGADPAWFAIDLRRQPHRRLIATVHDVTAARAHEAALEEARADAEALNLGKSRFLANMSHELRTPLNAIMGFSDVMRQRIFGELPGRYAEYADLIHDAGSHLLDLINDVLDMSKIEAERYELALEHIDAREPVQAALRLMRLQADEAGVQLRGVLPNGPLSIEADPRALKQITLNLVSNALKFTPRGGLVTVSLQGFPGALELSVVDTGIGIAPEDLQRLGRPFEQAGDLAQQSKGTGLGLSLVRALSELHGGEMAIESRLGEGAAVTVRLPVSSRAEPVAAELAEADAQR
ncbi:MAG TPA: HAMP domain-containing sensor histidine kinase [Caulobacteraceae bacterium]|jgi:cell cycle sensor histidine kinase DivJ|nr:HAMP domain-containing sensor histidine kinase [Caulobacteraceae bacterium]